MLGRWRGTPGNDTRDVEFNAIGVLKRREIEARILAPVVEALGREFGREKVLQIVGETIVGTARNQGRQLVQISAGHQIVPASQQVVAITPVFLLAWVLDCSATPRSAKQARLGTLSRRLTRCRRLPTISARRSSVPAFWHRPSEEC